MSYFYKLMLVASIGGIAGAVLNYVTGSMLVCLVGIPIGIVGGNWIARGVR